jgi:quercetin dioxygenase-like cupin family protein
VALLCALALTALAVACEDAAAPTEPITTVLARTVGSGVTGEALGQATFDLDGVKVKRITGRWHVELKAKDGLDIAVRRFSYEPGAQTGWHRHPGPVFIQVVSGEVTFYEAGDPTCTPTVVRAGESYLDTGAHAHIGRNESGAPAQDLVVLMGPPGLPPSDFRIDAPDPGTCSF